MWTNNQRDKLLFKLPLVSIMSTLGDDVPMLDISQMDFYRMQIETGNDLEQYTATNWFRRVLLSESDPPIVTILRSGVVQVLLGILARGNSQNEQLISMLQHEAAWALNIFCEGESEYIQFVVKQGAVPCFVRLLHSTTNEDIKEQASLALGNIASDSIQLRDMVIKAGAVKVMAKKFNPDAGASLVRATMWAMSTFCQGKPAPSLDVVRVLVPLLAMNVNSQDIEAVANACSALSYIADGEDDSEVR